VPHIPQTICAEDGVEMVVSKTGALLEMNATWGSYYKIYAERYECPDCGREVYLPADRVLMEHWHDDYADLNAEVQIDFADTRQKGL
jgi:hypothetical protein